MKYIRSLPDGEETAFKPMKVRSLKWHKKYWALLGDIAPHLTEFNISLGEVDAFMPIATPYDLHTALKLVTGHCITQHIKGTPYVLRIPKPTDFASMSGDEWTEFYPLALDAIHQRALPQIKVSEMREELTRLAS